MSTAIRLSAALFSVPLSTFARSVSLRGLCLVARFYERWLQRQALAELDERMLRDVGITRREAEQEIRKPFWR
jgi:uncharacterized protein YjiS (DUF1127 family)